MELIKCVVSCILIIQLLIAKVSSVDETLVEFTKGNDVADAVVRKIQRTGIFPDDQNLFRRIGFVETRFGEDPKTYRDDYFGGIWQVDEEHFAKTKNVTNPSDIYQQISTRFNINWSEVQWRDLLKPFYSGLAARLYLASLDMDFPGTSAEQAEFWLANYRYNSDIATTEQYVRLVRALESDPVCEGMVDICIVLDGSGSITPEKFQLARSFVAELARTFSLATSRIAFVLYSDEAEKIFDFDNKLSESEMNETIYNIRYPSLGTNTPAGLLMAVDFFKSTTTRIGVPRVLTTFTDGLYNKGNLPEAIAAVRQAELVSFAVGIGDEFDPLELMQIALNVPKRVFTLSNFDALAEFFYQMNSATCEVPQTPPIGESQSGSLNANETRYFKYDIPESGLTIKIDSEADLSGYYSYTEETPNSAVNDGTFDKVGVIPYPESRRKANGKQEPIEVVIYISIRSNSEKISEYVIEAVEGSQETPSTEITSETPEVTSETPEGTSETPEVTSKTPEVTSETPEGTSETPEVTSETPEITSETPEVTSETPEITSETPEDTSETPEVTSENTTSEVTVTSSSSGPTVTSSTSDTGSESTTPSGASSLLVSITTLLLPILFVIQ